MFELSVGCRVLGLQNEAGSVYEEVRLRCGRRAFLPERVESKVKQRTGAVRGSSQVLRSVGQSVR